MKLVRRAIQVVILVATGNWFYEFIMLTVLGSHRRGSLPELRFCEGRFCG